MARYTKDFQMKMDPQTIHSAVNQYLQAEGYEYINYDGENVFKKGSGVVSNPTFFKFSYFGNTVRMETWMKYAFFPGVYVGELGVTGVAGSAVKGSWKKRISHLETMLNDFIRQSAFYSSAPTQSNVNDETQLLNEDHFEETCVMNENKVEYCMSCGAQMSAGAAFCTACGQRNISQQVPASQPYAQQAPASQPYAQQAPASQPYAQQASASQPYAPAGYLVSRKEFIEKYAQPSLRRNITSIAILCYVCSGLTFVVSCFMNPMGIIDALILLGLALGMHLAKSKVCAILILILSIIEVLLSLLVGSGPIWWLIAGISAVVTFNKIEKQYKAFVQNGNRL